jgi:hypothetical protein
VLVMVLGTVGGMAEPISIMASCLSRSHLFAGLGIVGFVDCSVGFVNSFDAKGVRVGRGFAYCVE